jgi:hypothetical protein
MTAEKLDLVQSALTADSATAYAFLKKPSVGAGVTRLSSVEIMAPALTRRALECAKWAFAESVSGWGTDLLLGPAVRSACGPNSVGVVGSVAVRHAAPVDLGAGAFTPFCAATASTPGMRPAGSRSTSASNASCGGSAGEPGNLPSALALRPGDIHLTRESFPRS